MVITVGMILFISCLLTGAFLGFMILSLIKSDINKAVKVAIGAIMVAVALAFLGVVFAAVTNTSFGVDRRSILERYYNPRAR